MELVSKGNSNYDSPSESVVPEHTTAEAFVAPLIRKLATKPQPPSKVGHMPDEHFERFYRLRPR